jgi:RNA polymerase sigma-70 factor (ECF subfamily)
MEATRVLASMGTAWLSRESAAGTSDVESLVPACRGGDRAAFARLFDSCKDRVYALAVHLSGDPFEAADVTQEVFLKLLTRIGQYRSDARFTTWLHRIVVNTWRDRHKQRRRLVSLEHADAAGCGLVPGQERSLAQAEQRRRVRRALARVREEFREVLVLRYVSELSYDEIAAICGISAGTVASRLNRGLRDLGRALGEDGAEP